MRLFYLLPIILSSCIILPASQPKPEPVVHSLPAPVYPDECVANWYAKTSLPPCVETWITDITKQQKSIERRKKPSRHQKNSHL